jgi:bacteriorhodopsin
MTLSLLRQTIYFSILAQIITGIITVNGIWYKVPIEHMILKDINILELIVQSIEFIFYLYISLAILQTKSIAPRRYFDWFITTPTMLISTILYFKYKTELDNLKSNNAEQKEIEETMKNIRIWDILESEKKTIIYIVIANALMLILGLLGEMGYINIFVSNGIGFIFFGIVFYIIYKYAKDNEESMRLYMFFLIVWSLYGIAHLLPNIPKNISYNLLDIVAKNFYGLFIFWKITQVQI